MLSTTQVILAIVFLRSPDNTGQHSHPPDIVAGPVVTRHSLHIATQLPGVEPVSFYICLSSSDAKLETAYTTLSLAFDICAFIAIVVSACKYHSRLPGEKFRLTGVVRTVVQDSTIYFAFIFTPHLTLTMYAFLAKVCVYNRLICYRF